MQKVFDTADQYCRESNWKTMAALKICLLAMGMIIGMAVPKKAKKKVLPVCGIIYGGTVIPLIRKYFEILLRA